MLNCLNKTIKKIDYFQEECSKLVFGLRKLLGEDRIIKKNDFITKLIDEDIHLYYNNSFIGKANKTGIFIESEYVSDRKIFLESTKILKKSLKEMDGGMGVGASQSVDDQNLGGQEIDETSVADVSVNPIAFNKNQGKRKPKQLNELEQPVGFKKTIFDANTGKPKREIVAKTPKAVESKTTTSPANPGEIVGKTKEY